MSRRRTVAMEVNDNAGHLIPRIASKLAPTGAGLWPAQHMRVADGGDVHCAAGRRGIQAGAAHHQ
ncbi:hypothetical protein D3C73_824410 [compost metagenome]